MTSSGRQAVLCAAGLALGVVLGCAGKRKGPKNPEECMRTCDQENCTYVAQGVGDNAEYLECLEACEEGCIGEGE